MSIRSDATSSGNPTHSESNDPFDVFAGLTPIDVIDGELVPRRR